MSEGLPRGWATAELGELVTLVNGCAFKPSMWGKEGLPIIRIQNLNNPDAEFNFYEGRLSEKYLVRKGDLLFAWSGTPGTSFGAHIWRGTEAWLNQHIFKVLFDRESFDDRFLRYAINQNLQSYISQAHGGAGLAHITKGKFEAERLIFPPLPEQRRIVAKIEELFTRLDAGIAALNKVKQQIKRYRQAVLRDAFTGELTREWRERELRNPDSQLNREPAAQLLARIHAAAGSRQSRRGTASSADARVSSPDVPPGWVSATIDKITDPERECSYGVLQPGAHVDTGVPLVRVGDIQEGRVCVTDMKRVSPRIAAQYPRTTLRGGEVLITLVGAIGRTAVAPASLAGANTARAVGVIPLSPHVPPEYVELWFRNPAKMAEMVGKAHEVARKTLNLEDVRSAVVALPSLSEQRQIVAEVGRYFSLADFAEKAVDESLAKAAHLRQSILKQAFDGKLVPQDPNDEPAEKLLARIRAGGTDSDGQRAGTPRRRRTADDAGAHPRISVTPDPVPPAADRGRPHRQLELF